MTRHSEPTPEQDADEHRRPTGAVLSSCATHLDGDPSCSPNCAGRPWRYHLTRPVGPEPGTVLWVMLNPSVADTTDDDPTIRRCRNFTRAWGRGALQVVNLYAFRSTKPGGLWKARDAVGPENDWWLESAARTIGEQPDGLVVVAWGGGGGRKALARAAAVQQVLLAAKVPLWCLGTCEERGEPRHPLFIPDGTELAPWPWS